MAPGMSAMLDPELKKTGTVEARFARQFPQCLYPRTTYFAIQNTFKDAGSELLQQYITAGRTPEGLMTELKKVVDAKRKEGKSKTGAMESRVGTEESG